MDRGDLSDAEWQLVGPLLPSERGRWARLQVITEAFSMVCFMCCGSAAPGATYMIATASGTRSMSGSDAGPSKACGMHYYQRWSIWG